MDQIMEQMTAELGIEEEKQTKEKKTLSKPESKKLAPIEKTDR